MAYDTKAIDELQASLQEYLKQIRPRLAQTAVEKGEQEAKDRETPGWQKALLSAAVGYLTGGLGSAIMGAVAPAAGAAIGAIPGGKAVVDATKAAVDLATGAGGAIGGAASVIPAAAKYGLGQATLGSTIAKTGLSLPGATAATAATASQAGASGNLLDMAQGGIRNIGAALTPNEENVWGAIKSGVKGYGARTPEEAAGVGLETGISNLDTLMAARKEARTRAASQAELEATPEHILKLGKMKTDILKYAEPLSGTLEPGEELPNDVFELEGVLPGVKYFKYRKQPNYIQQFIQGGGEQ